MKLELGKATILAGCVVALGCSATAVNQPAPTKASYQLQAVDDLQDPGAIIAGLPASISVADAAKVLVQIKPEEVRLDGGSYGLQAMSDRATNWRTKDTTTRTNSTSDNDRRDRMRTNDNDRRDRIRTNDNDRPRHRRDYFYFGRNSPLYNSSLFSYYPYGSYYFPYQLNNGIYSPYSVNCTTPYLVRNSAYLYPYTTVGLNTTTGQTTPCYDALGAPGPGLIPTINNY